MSSASNIIPTNLLRHLSHQFSTHSSTVDVASAVIHLLLTGRFLLAHASQFRAKLSPQGLQESCVIVCTVGSE